MIKSLRFWGVVMSKFIKLTDAHFREPFLLIRISKISFIKPQKDDNGVFVFTEIGVCGSLREHWVKETPEEIIKLIEEKS